MYEAVSRALPSVSDFPTSREYELIRLCARVEADETRRAAMREVVAEGVDWHEVHRLAAYHKVRPLVRRHLQDVAPQDLLDHLLRVEMKRAVSVLFLSSEMARIARAFDEEGLDYLVLKGPSLSEAYGGVALRPFVDNDLLVRRSDFGRVEAALTELGFNERKRGDSQQSGYLLVHGEYTFGRGVGSQISTVDVHTRIVPMGYAYEGPFDALASRARTLEMAGHPVPVPDWEDLFLILCVNALKDQWNCLRLATDLAEVAPHIEDWAAVEDRAKASRSLRAYRTAVLVAVNEVGATYPEAVVDRARDDRTAADLAREIRVHLRTFHEDRVMSGGDRARLVLRTQDGVLGQLRYLGYVGLRRLTERYVDPYESEAASAR